ncbi:tetratricopeptide TPR_2 repeat protein [[Leptolyngbya] sp. PCC 7376]|uniref:CHAT domain-containing protein n=1 Tax=[Leptolyngbya] sp. PCC 7376 TaxID=111781 RepID=UPI00029F2F57|nr:CHAT domain-containing protein [[Leptolyngbya] sp. PCC 7376]AFY40321.1 tetratricopeptide TPR_2 repeat protein [[Leptolyngbya] sp. PCC 7376]
MRKKHFYFSLSALAIALSLSLNFATGSMAADRQTATTQTPQPESIRAQNLNLLQQGTTAYQNGNLKQAIALWQEAHQSTDPLLKIQAANYLGLAYPEQGQWQAARDVLEQGITELTSLKHSSKQSLTAQNLNNQARLAFLQGQTETALDLWQQTAKTYRETDNAAGLVGSKMNQAQALQSLGQYRRAKNLLVSLVDDLDQQPESQLTVQGLRNLGSAFYVIGDLEQAKVLFEASWAMGDRLALPEETALTLIHIGNVAETLDLPEVAFEYYRQSYAESQNPTTRLKSQLQQLRLQVEYDVTTDIQPLIADIQTKIAALPGDRHTIDAVVHFSESLLLDEKAQQLMPPRQLATLLAKHLQTARTLQDSRSEAFLLQQLGNLYLSQSQWANATAVTTDSLRLAEALNAPDLISQSAWQLGRLHNLQGDRPAAIAAYQQAVAALQNLRSDLVAINTDVQFNFRDRVEPVYRELVGLLLAEDEPSQANLKLARDVLENLQLAELDNFFRNACLDATPVNVDEIDTQAAVLYPIILEDTANGSGQVQLDVILSLPDQSFRYLSHRLDKNTLDQTLKNFYSSLYPGYSDRERLKLSQTIHNWLIGPLKTELDAQKIDTLVFVPDGFFRNIPLAALYDGDRYLIESYSLALSPGLQLFPQGLRQTELASLTVGLTEARQNFNELPGVKTEIDEIAKEIDATVLLDKDFTKNSFQVSIDNRDFPVVHLATHGQFSSNPDDTFLLTWDGRIGIEDLDRLFEKRRLGKLTPIELLVLSACQTAAGDDRATLGLAGLALRSGALSTLASLWSVNDESTAALMGEFYRALSNTDAQSTKAQALREAQMTLIQNPKYQHPYYWSAFVLVGNWL